MAGKRQVALMAWDVTTTEFAMAVRSTDGEEGYASTSMRGGMFWRGDSRFPGFDLAEIPRMAADLLARLAADGWSFSANNTDSPGYLSISCRQHDQVVLDRSGEPLLPALSWQCNAATDDVVELKKLGLESMVGTIEPRFVLPKLRCVLREASELRTNVGTVMLTGDWITWKLTTAKTLSSSDGLSNGLVDQQSRKLATDAIAKAGLEPSWFPTLVSSGSDVGIVTRPGPTTDSAWEGILSQLAGWHVVAGLGDNHASAVGCGMLDDHRTLVVSAGTSGTINRSCPIGAQLPTTGHTLRFEFYDQSLLLLLMLGDCGAWYNRFLDQFAHGYRHDLPYLNHRALESDLGNIRRVLHCDSRHTESFPPAWPHMSLSEHVSSTQFSITLELLLRVKQMMAEVERAQVPEIETFVLTGGLSQSPLVQATFAAGIRCLSSRGVARVSGRTGPLRYKTSAYGALINAELPLHAGSLRKIHATGDRFPLQDCQLASHSNQATLEYHLRACGL